VRYLELGVLTLNASRSLFAALLALTVSSPAMARAEERDVSGTIEANPLRIQTRFAIYIITGPDSLTQSLRAVAGMGRSVTTRLDVGKAGLLGVLEGKYTASVVSVSGHATAPSQLLTSPASDASGLEAIGPETEYTITGVSGDFMQVKLADGKTGYVPASFASVGEDHWLARDIGKDILGPIFAHTSASNDARTFHPDGFYFEGKVTSLDPKGPLAKLASRLVGSAVVRPSLGAHKTGTPDGKFDVPGFTIRLTTTGAAIGPNPNPGDQNFTFLAGLESLANLATAPFTENQFDYLAPGNTYYPAISYRIAPNSATDSEPTQDISLRVVPEAFTPSDATLVKPTNGDQRDAKLKLAVQEHKAALRIEGQIKGGNWTPLVRITMDEPLAMDNEAFHYYPDLAGRGLIPQGVVNALRAELYPASQAARPTTGAERTAEDAAKAAAAKAAAAGEAKPTPMKGFIDRLKRIGE
jgi:hypothetical protein